MSGIRIFLTVTSIMVCFAAVPLLAADDESEFKAANFSTGAGATYEHLDFSKRTKEPPQISYSYGPDRKEMTLKFLGTTKKNEKTALAVQFPNGLVLDLAFQNNLILATDRKGKYSKQFRWEYEGPVDGIGTFCTPCVEEKDAIDFVKKLFLQKKDAPDSKQERKR